MAAHNDSRNIGGNDFLDMPPTGTVRANAVAFAMLLIVGGGSGAGINLIADSREDPWRGSDDDRAMAQSRAEVQRMFSSHHGEFDRRLVPLEAYVRTDASRLHRQVAVNELNIEHIHRSLRRISEGKRTNVRGLKGD